MNNSLSLQSVIAICLLTTFLQSCTTAQERLLQSATVKGRIEAGVRLPELPSDCKRSEDHAALTEGAEVRSVLIRERAALDRQNSRGQRCSKFYDDVRGRFAK